jgi:hypothetical protein
MRDLLECVWPAVVTAVRQDGSCIVGPFGFRLLCLLNEG